MALPRLINDHMYVGEPMTETDPFSVQGKVTIVTGGTAGIGLGIVQEFVRCGATVIAVGRRADGAEVLARNAPGAVFYRADLADSQAPERIIATALEAHGRVDVLVNNAALIAGNVPILEMTPEYIDSMLAVNVRAVLLLTRAFANARKRIGPGGKIVNVGSVEGFIATLPAGMGAYSASKTAIRGMTVSLARELAPLGIGVNAVAPGAVVHESLLEHHRADPASRARIDAGLAALVARTNVGRLGTPQDIANVCRFLASSASDYISGQTILADGGVTRT
jgi:2-dehydro-3-deoxy-D-gluconate 5-dehydrogenase